MGSWDPLLNVAVAACFFNVSMQGPSQRRLYKDLMRPYDRLERPVSDDVKPLTVRIGITLMQVLDLDEKNQVLTTSMFVTQEWNAHNLQWNESEYPGVTFVVFPESLVWRPDIVLYNSADKRSDAPINTHVLVHPDGSCIYVPPGIVKSTCSIDLRWFPFDVQRCELKFGAWAHDGNHLDLQLLEDHNYDADYTKNGEWDLVEITGWRNDTWYACCPDTPYHSATFRVVLRRRALFYSLNLLVPCVVISSMALLVFLLPADSGEKISLGITVLVSLIIFMLLGAQIMPASSQSVPVIVQYFAATMVIVGLSVLSTVLVLQCHHHDPRGDRMPKGVQVFLLNWCARFLCMKRPGSSPPNIDPTSLLYQPLLPTNQASSGGKAEPELAEILDEVRYIAKRLRDRCEEESLGNEWKFAASVIDRLCLVAFSLVFFFCIIGILV